MGWLSWALRGSLGGWRVNTIGLVWSCIYIAWSMLAQQHVLQHAQKSLRAAGLSTDQVFATPAPFSTALWRVVAVDGDHMHEGFYALLDGGRPMRFDAPNFFFTFNIGKPLAAGQTPSVATQERRAMDVDASLVWLGTRMRGTDIEPPRGP